MVTWKPVENDLKDFTEGLKTLGRADNDVIMEGEKGKQGGLLLPPMFILIASSKHGKFKKNWKSL